MWSWRAAVLSRVRPGRTADVRDGLGEPPGVLPSAGAAPEGGGIDDGYSVARSLGATAN